MYLHEANSRDDIFPGGILVPQTFGGMANWNPHVHALITDTCWDREGNCYPMPEIDSSDIQGIVKLFSSLIFTMLLEEGMNRIDIDTSALASGMYFARLTAGNTSATTRMVIVR